MRRCFKIPAQLFLPIGPLRTSGLLEEGDLCSFDLGRFLKKPRDERTKGMVQDARRKNPFYSAHLRRVLLEERGHVRKEQLPAQLVENLHPKIREAYEKLPMPITSRIAELVSRVPSNVKIRPNRLVKYAFVVVAAERALEVTRVSIEHAGRARAEHIGERHGFELGYEQTEEAQRRHRRGRQARQRIEASLQSVLKGWRKTEQVVRRQRTDLPIQLSPMVSDQRLAAVRAMLAEIIQALRLGGTPPTQGDPSGQESTRSSYTYHMWLNLLPSYKGKWHEMYELALSWRLTGATSIEAFRHIVRKSCLGSETVNAPFGSAWIQLLSEEL